MSFLKSLLAPKRVPLEEQLVTLAESGIRLKPQFSIDDVLEHFDREKLETSRYIGLVITMGSESKRSPHEPLSGNVWHLDAECIDEHGDYAYIAERMKELAQGELPIENIRDRVDRDNGDAWIEFEINGQTIHWGARVQGKWIDPDILSRFCGLLEQQSNATRRYTFFDLKGQHALVGCATEEEMLKLRKQVGLRFSWLK